MHRPVSTPDVRRRTGTRRRELEFAPALVGAENRADSVRLGADVRARSEALPVIERNPVTEVRPDALARPIGFNQARSFSAVSRLPELLAVDAHCSRSVSKETAHMGRRSRRF